MKRAEQPARGLSKVSLTDLLRRINNLREADLKSLSAGAVSLRMGLIIDQYMFQIRPLQLNAIYRARKNKPNEMFSSIAQLWYPPASAITRPGRLNEAGQVRLYGANMPNTAIFELNPAAGDEFTVLIAGTQSEKIETLNVAFIGLERALAPEVQHLTDGDIFRRAPHFRSVLGPANYKKWLLIDDYLSEIIGIPVSYGEEHKYKPTIALSKLLFTAPNMDAVNYPSVATNDYGINICMKPERADQLFAPFEAWHVRVGENDLHRETGEALKRITFLRRSREITANGTIEWLPPGEGINGAEIMRFVRRRIKPLREWPLSEKRTGGVANSPP